MGLFYRIGREKAIYYLKKDRRFIKIRGRIAVINIKMSGTVETTCISENWDV